MVAIAGGHNEQVGLPEIPNFINQACSMVFLGQSVLDQPCE